MKYLDYPPIWLLGFLALSYATTKVGLVFSPPFWLSGLGGVLIVAGVLLMCAAAFAMWRHHTTVIPHRVPAAIVTDGVFKFTRNPIYLGDVFTLTGFALLFGSPAGIVLVPVFMVLIQRRFIVGEERGLRTEFEKEFQIWAQTTRRWL